MSKEILDKFLTEMGNLLKSAKDFTLEQAPQVAKEVLHFNLATSILWAVAALIGLYAIYRVFKWAKAYSRQSHDDSVWIPVGIFGSVAAIGLTIAFFCNVSDILKITLAPRLYLIEYFASLVKSVK